MDAAGPHAGLTTEHLKSHLQKYRLNYERSRQEFLEYYDQSAKNNLKRRRKSATTGKSEHNSMFVFPICPKKDDKDSDSDAVSEEIEDDTPESASDGHHRLQRHRSMHMEDKEQTRRSSQAISLSRRHSSPHQYMHSGAASVPAGAAAAESYAANAYKANNTRGMQLANRAAMAAAAAAYRYPLGMAMDPATAAAVAAAGASGAAGAGAGVGLEQLTDPQWNILSSLMSPHLTGAVIHPAGTEGGNGGDQPFSLHDEPSDLQVQMHLAMQAQMNLHRQMLTRKVEVSQHLSNHPIEDNALYAHTPWGAQAQMQANVQQQQQQQQYQYSQHQPRSILPGTKSTQNTNAQDSQARGQADYRSFAAMPRNAMAPASMAMTNAMLNGSSTTSSSSATTSATQAPMATTNKPLNITPSSQAQSNNTQTGTTPGVDQHQQSGALRPQSFSDGSAPASDAPMLGFDNRTDDESLDLYRWDRIDLNVALDDDDLFGFLKS